MKLCKQCGFDAATIRARLALLELGAADEPRIRELQQCVLRAHADGIVEEFFLVLKRDPGFTRFMEGRFDEAHLRRMVQAYIRSLGQGFDRQAYFEERLRVGFVHERAQVPLSLYQCAHRLLQQLVIDRIPESVRADPARYGALIGLILKISALDMSLAIEAYHVTKVGDLEKSLDTVLHEDEKLRHKIDTDTLTGLASNEHARAVMREALQNLERYDQPMCLIMSDLDHFKEVNDSHGHLVGDRVLQDVAARMQSAVRDFDTVGRYGGEEFIVVLENTALGRAQEIAERIRLRVGGSPVHIDDLVISITISQGLSAARQGDDIDALISRADEALYAAKAAGRDCVKIA